MHKVFKRILSFLLATVLLLSIDTTTIAAEPTSQSNKITQHVNILEGEEGINTIAEIYNISYNEAVDKYNELRAGVDRVEERYVHYNAGNGYTIEAGCLVRVQCGSGHCNFVEITEKWSKAIGSGSYTWDDFYTYANIEGTLKNTIRFQTRGNLEVATTESASAGFEAAGFTFGGSIGTTYYYRKTISFEKTT